MTVAPACPARPQGRGAANPAPLCVLLLGLRGAGGLGGELSDSVWQGSCFLFPHPSSVEAACDRGHFLGAYRASELEGIVIGKQ